MTNQRSIRVSVLVACALATTASLVAGAGYAAESRRAPPLTAPVCPPVVLSYIPRWQPTDWVAPPERQPLQPSYFAPLASEDFRPYEPLPELELDLSPAKGGKTTVGGWIEVGYHSRGFGQ